MKRQPARHPLQYYIAEMGKTGNPNRINDLLEEAAAQPLDVLSPSDFERVYWYANDILRGENE